MGYLFQDRLKHLGGRFAETNFEEGDYIRGDVTLSNIKFTPIISKAEEIIPGISMTRIEFQKFSLYTSEIESLGMPEHGDKIRLYRSGEEFRVVPVNIVHDERHASPAYFHTSSTRDRLLISTERLKATEGLSEA